MKFFQKNNTWQLKFLRKKQLTNDISQEETTKLCQKKKTDYRNFLGNMQLTNQHFTGKKNTKFSYREHCSLKWKKTTPDLWHFSGEKKGNWNFSWKKQRIFLKDIFRKNGLKWKVLRIKITDHWHFSGKKTTDKRYVRRKNNKSFQKKNNNW